MMGNSLARGGLILAASVLTLHAAQGQTLPAGSAAPAAEPADTSGGAAPDADIEVVGPGMATITVTGSRERDVQRAAPEVISVLSSEDIARTGEGDIAGALSRVTGLSVVRGGFVYVRGLGDRYSQALLNGSPLPSPEPLRRAVPLDLFPTDVIASSLVQKTYSPNFAGEFGGGVINLTTLAVPPQSFLNVGFGVSGDTETTNQLGYTYYGDGTDWFGYDDGARDTPPALWQFYNSRERLSSGNVDAGEIAKQFVTANNAVIQRNSGIPANVSGSVTGGTSWMLGDSRLGLIATVGLSNKWRTRDNVEQTPANADLSALDKDYRTVSTENRAVVNALLGLGLEFGDGQRIRWTNLYIHDTLKRASLSEGQQNNQHFGQDFLEQNTAWYERQLADTQLAGTFRFDPVSVNARASYATSKRQAPFELGLGYVRTNQAASPYGAYYLNRLDNGQTGFATISFGDLSEDLISAGLDASMKLGDRFVVSAGVDYTDTQRDSTRREFQIIAPSTFPNAVAMLRPDYLLGPAVIDYYDIGLVETTESDPAFAAELETKAAFVQLQAQLLDTLEASVGVRYEKGLQSVDAIPVFNTASGLGAATRLDKDYFLPAATLTWKFADDMQLRFNASRTLARPQFRELIFQAYFDPETNRAYRGNPLLVDSEFFNAEARYEWYYSGQDRLSVAGFYKKIDRPIEAFTGFNDNSPVTSFANAPSADLYGGEAEVQKRFHAGDYVGLLSGRDFVLLGNYTWTQSKIKVGTGDTVNVFGTSVQPATNFFSDGAPLTGQSDHLVNLQFGLEGNDRLSQQTLLVSYASDRVTSRGAAGLPDIYESPGISLDFVAREGVSAWGLDMELKFEARNLLRRGYREFQERDGNRVFYNRYDVGTTFAASVTLNF